MKSRNVILIQIISILMLLLFLKTKACTQNLLGLTGNYAGVNAVNLNPSSIANSKLKLDVNFFTFGGHFQNDYYIIPKHTYNPVNPFQNGFADFNAYQGNPDKNLRNYLFTKEMLSLPSVMYSNGRNALAFQIKWRMEADLKSAPADIIKSLYEGMIDGRNINQEINTDKQADKFHFALASWEELNAVFSKMIISDNYQYLAGGITAKLLLGNTACFFNNKKMEYYYNNPTSISFKNIEAEFGAVTPSGLINGIGMGADIGVTYCVKDYSNAHVISDYFNYKYKFGAAILDIGGIRFNNGLTASVNSNEGNVNATSNTVNNTQDIDNKVKGLATKAGLNYFLPTSLSLQFDYNINNVFYVGAHFINNLHFTGSQVKRPALLAVTTRLEKRWFEIAMPFSIYDWRSPRLGFHMRFYNISFGTEKLGWLFKFKDYDGVDGYISLSFNIGKKALTKPMFYHN